MGTPRTALAVAAGILCLGPVLASGDFDYRLAETYAGLFAPAVEGQTGKALHCIQPETLLKWLSQGEPVTGLDIRTPAETGVFGLALPGSLRIPLHELFTPDHLDQVPQDRKVIVLCQTGIRAGMATLALRHLGYEQVYVLQGGYQGLTAYLDPGTAHAQAPSFLIGGQAVVIPKAQASVVTTGPAGDQPPASISAARRVGDWPQVPQPLSPLSTLPPLSPLSPFAPPPPPGAPGMPGMPDMPDMPNMPEMPGLPGMLGMPGWSSVPGMPDWSNWNPNGGDEDGRHPSLSHWPPTGAEGYPAYGHHPHGYRGWLSGRAYPHWRAGPGPRSWHARRWHLTWPSPPLAPPPSPSPFPPVFARITLRDATTLIQSPHLPPSPSSLLGVPWGMTSP